MNSLPLPKLPNVDLNLLYSMFADAFGIAIVSYSLNISFAKYFSNKNKYAIEPNQVRYSY